MNEREAMAILVSAARISYGLREHALGAAGSAENLLADPHAYADVLGEAGVMALRAAMKNADRMLSRLYEDGVHLIVRGGEGYPERLEKTAKPPHLLFCRGSGDLCDPIPLAIVGTRSADSYGLRHTRRIACELAGRGVCVVSGLALGIDAAAHAGALDGQGRTVAVLGGALDKFYPTENRGLMRQILESGGSVVSEYPPGTPPTRYSFLQRNRIIAGLSLGVLVTQAPMKSGALSTVNDALEEGREVFAMPGDIDRAASQLPNHLIREGAHVAVCAEDICDLLAVEQAWEGKRVRAADSAPPAQERKPVRRLGGQEKIICDLLQSEDLDFDALCERSGMGSDALGTALMMLELDGIVQSLPGATYRLA